MIYDKEVTSFNSGTGSSSTSGSSSDSVSGLKFELSLSLDLILTVSMWKAIMKWSMLLVVRLELLKVGDTNNILNIKEDVDDSCPSILCNKDIISNSDGKLIIEISHSGESLIHSMLRT